MIKLGSRHEYALAALLFASVGYVLWSVLEPWTGVDSWLNIDNRNYHPDMMAYGVKRLMAGEFPLWNPYQAAGVPFFSVLQGMVLYPPTWLAFIFTIDTTHLFSKYLHLVLSAFSIYFYLRVLKLHPLAAFLGGLFFITGNFYLAFTMSVTATYPLATVGILLAACEKILQSTSRPTDVSANRWSLLFVVLLTFQVFAGYIQSVAFTGYLLCLYIPFRIGQLYVNDRRKDVILVPLIRFTAMAVLTIMLASIQLLPTFEMSTYSDTHNLQKGMDLSAVNIPILPSLPFVELLNDPVIPITQTPWGIAFWCLIVCGLIASKTFRPLVAFYVLITIAFLFLARGTEAWLYSFYYHYFPTGSWFRWPEKFLLLSNLTLSILVGFGLHQCHKFLSRRKWRPIDYVFWCYCFGIFSVTFLLRYSSVGIQVEQPDWHWEAFGKDYSSYRLSDLSMKARHLARHPAGFKTQPPISYDKAEAALDYLRTHSQNERILALHIIDWAFAPDLSAKWGVREQLYAIEDYEPLLSARYRQFGETMGASPLFLRNVPSNLKMMSLFGTRWVLVSQNWLDRRPRKLPDTLLKVFEDQHFRIYEFPRVVPRSYVASDIVNLPEDKILDYLSSESFDPYSEAVIADTFSVKSSAGDLQIEAADIIDYQPERVVIELPEKGREGLLILTDQYDTNWRATIDGKEAEIIPVNHLFRGVAVSADSRRVIFSYRPMSFYWGTLISSLAVLLIIVFHLVVKRRRSNLKESPGSQFV